MCPVWTLLLRGEHYCAVKAPELEDEGVRLCVDCAVSNVCMYVCIDVCRAYYCAVKAPELEDEGVRLCVCIHMHAQYLCMRE